MSNKEIDNLWDKVQIGNEKAFDVLFRELYPSLCTFAYRLLNNLEEAEETVQDAFVNLWQNRNQIHIKGSIKSYLYQTVHNLAINKLEHFKTNKFLPNKVVSREKWEQIHNSYVFDDATIQMLEAAETEILILKAVEKLPDKCKEVFVLSRFDDLSYDEISAKLQLSLSTVRVHIFRALDLIRNFIEKNNH